MRAVSPSSIVLLPWMVSSVLGGLVVHDETFVPDHVLRITAQNISVACESRYSVVVNGTSPGPQIRLKAGAATWIRVYNDMTDANLTMHWHGLSQRMAQFSDGSPLASQWPMAPMTYFDYEVEALPQDAGTYFYHSHVGIQAITAAGSLVVEDCGPPPYIYDDERTFLFSDYFNKTDESLEKGLAGVPFVFGGETNAVLLNGRGIGVGHTAGSNGSDTSCHLPVVEIAPGKTYRFRFIGSTSLSHTVMAFEGHPNMSVISVDGGQYTVPAPTDMMALGSGQRFDVLFQAKTTEELAAEGKSSYYMQFETRDRPTRYTGYGILRYTTNHTTTATVPHVEAPLPQPTQPILTIPNITYDFLESTLQPLIPHPDFPTLADVTRRVTINAVQLISPQTNQLVWRFNNLSWTEATNPVPLMVDIYTRGEAAVPNYPAALANYGWDPATKAFPAKVGEVLEIVFQNTGSLANNGGGVDVHPMHAHGAHYWDVGSGNGSYDAEANEARIVETGYRPVKRDTTMLYRYVENAGAGVSAGWRAWRIRVDDPGVWMIHCHTLQHMIMGMQTLWVVGNASEIQKTPTELSQGYFTYGGSVNGNETDPPTCFEQFDHSSAQGTCNA